MPGAPCTIRNRTPAGFHLGCDLKKPNLRRRRPTMFARMAAFLLACYTLSDTGAPTRAGEIFSWQEAYAKVLPHGDLEWTPLPFRFEKGSSLRYIDFDAGNDENDGTTNLAPWKHHPWDSQA